MFNVQSKRNRKIVITFYVCRILNSCRKKYTKKNISKKELINVLNVSKFLLRTNIHRLICKKKKLFPAQVSLKHKMCI